jgi:hypothetical protein
MPRHIRLAAVFWVVAALALTGCAQSAAESAEEDAPPATVEHSAKGDRVVLTERAATRVGVETDAVRARDSALVVPYSAILYTPDGAAWVYTNPEPLVFARADVTVERITGDEAILSDGPPTGTAVVTVGAEELFGTEFEFEED